MKIFANKFTILLCLTVFLWSANCGDCLKADFYQCLTPLCSNFAWSNAACRSASTTCTSVTQAYSGTGTCITCQSQPNTTCTNNCLGYFWDPEGPTCLSCTSLFGFSCVNCTTTACTMCSYSSGQVVATDGQSCVASTCASTIPNCLRCYKDWWRNFYYCQICLNGFKADSSGKCVTDLCKIPRCLTCLTATTCLFCQTGYQPMSSGTQCLPICSDINCIKCRLPGICHQCNSKYTLTDGKCILGSTTISGCFLADYQSICRQCYYNYQRAFNGAKCVRLCQDINCQYCNPSCLACNPGYTLVNTTCIPSLCPVQYCSTCFSLTACSTCQPFFTLSGDNLTCTPTCSFTVNGCSLCSSNTECSVCAIGYKLITATSCQPYASINNCKISATTTACLVCNPGYRLSTDHTTCQLACIDPNCLTCSMAEVCTQCSPTTSLVTTNGITYCQPYCAIGEIKISPTACQGCNTIHPACATCILPTGSASIVCTSCFNTHFLSGSNSCTVCSDIINNCLTCSDPFACKQCKNNYQLTPTGTCIAYNCAATLNFCEYCNPTNNTVCLRCVPGFNLAANNTCDHALSPSYSYNAAGGSASLQCARGTFENIVSVGGQNALLCTPCPDSNCLSCDANQCITCSNYYYLSGTQKCEPCPPNCLTCNYFASCLTCDYGYFKDTYGLCTFPGGGKVGSLAADGKYYICMDGCKSCALSVLNVPICLVTEDGFSINGGYMMVCYFNCKSCFYDYNVCSECYEGWTLYKNACWLCSDPNAIACLPGDQAFSTSCAPGYVAAMNGAKALCQACAPYCSRCDSAGVGKCDSGKCSVGYVMLTGTTNCTQCLGNCPKCSPSNPALCTACPNGQYFDSTKTCKPCNSTCATCWSASACVSCPKGASLVGTACISNPDYCIFMATATTCSVCFERYKLSDNASSCVAVTPTCNTNSSCTSCAQGTYFSAGRCNACTRLAYVTNCIACAEVTDCIKCADGYYLTVSSKRCDSCPTNCTTCISTFFCTSAAPGYFIQVGPNSRINGKLSPCASPCSTCANQNNFCTSCPSGYSLNGTQCLTNSTVQIHMVLSGTNDGSPLFSETDPQQTQLYKLVTGFNRLTHSICKKLPAQYDTSTTDKCAAHIKSTYVGTGSLVYAYSVPTSPFSSPSDALSSLSQAYASNQAYDGFNAMTVTVTGTTPSSSGSSSSATAISSSGDHNLALVLGVSIPLVIILMGIIIFLVVRKKNQQTPVTTTANEQIAQSNIQIQIQQKDQN